MQPHSQAKALILAKLTEAAGLDVHCVSRQADMQSGLGQLLSNRPLLRQAAAQQEMAVPGIHELAVITSQLSH
ncbi:hypothetical protein D3C75_1299070 [compost metagenome]